MSRQHFLYCPKCLYFNDTCDCGQNYNHAGEAHDNCRQPTNDWPKMERKPELFQA